MKKLKSLIAFLICLHLGCNENRVIHKDLILVKENFKVNLILNQIEYTSINDTLYTFVKGSLSIHNISLDTIFFNLNTIKLNLGNSAYSDIYINSIASINIKEEKINSNANLKKHVYFAFNKKIHENELGKISLVQTQ